MVLVDSDVGAGVVCRFLATLLVCGTAMRAQTQYAVDADSCV